MLGFMILEMVEKRIIIKRTLLITSVAFVVLQFVRPEKNEKGIESKNDIEQVVFVPDNIKLTLKMACYDCHSNHTVYPWYAEIQPIGLWLNYHVEEGKEHLNFSEFATYSIKKQDHKLEETAEEIGEKKMPLGSYIFIHKNAQLSDKQIQELQNWVEAARKEIKYSSTL